MPETISLAVAGYGLVGRRHAEAIAKVRGVDVAGVIDPDPAATARAASDGHTAFRDLESCLGSGAAAGIILATPNAMHVEQAMRCIAHGVPVLVEKPIATHSAEAEALVDRADQSGVAVLVGHHRRYNPLVHRAHEIIARGDLGRIGAVQATCWLHKPNAYFEEAPWRRRAGAGPVAVNLVHDVDLLRYLCGEVQSVRAVARPALRGGDNEDIAGALLEFSNGAIGTVSVSDSIAAPWSWEMTSGEYPVYPRTSESCYLIGGTDASLSLPDLRIWRHESDAPDWWTPISATAEVCDATDPLVNQIAHFADVIRGDAPPLVTGHEGLKTLRVIEAVQQAARCGDCVRL